jgi:hypothetical protein
MFDGEPGTTGELRLTVRTKDVIAGDLRPVLAALEWQPGFNELACHFWDGLHRLHQQAASGLG